MIDNDTIERARRADLGAILEADLGASVRAGAGRRFWLCPFHQEQDASFCLFPDNRWYCFGGCATGGDAIAYVQKRHGLGFTEAVAWLTNGDRPTATATPSVATRRPGPVAMPPESDWQERAAMIMVDCAASLMADAGEVARQYLCGRGLTDETMARWYIGRSDGTDRHGLAVARGWTIPHYHRTTNEIWAIKIRLPKRGGQRYACVAGSKPHLWGLDNLNGHTTAIVCEGELDGLLLWQQAGDLVAVVAQGDAGRDRGSLPTWLPWLGHLERIWIATDADKAGTDAWERWQGATARARRAVPPTGNDLTDAHQAGADLRAWVEFLLSSG